MSNSHRNIKFTELRSRKLNDAATSIIYAVVMVLIGSDLCFNGIYAVSSPTLNLLLEIVLITVGSMFFALGARFMQKAYRSWRDSMHYDYKLARQRQLLASIIR